MQTTSTGVQINTTFMMTVVFAPILSPTPAMTIPVTHVAPDPTYHVVMSDVGKEDEGAHSKGNPES